jgi:hypothetical protein
MESRMQRLEDKFQTFEGERQAHKSFFSLCFPCLSPPLPAASAGHQEEKEEDCGAHTGEQKKLPAVQAAHV